MAATVPISVEFHIHHVVPVFHNKQARNTWPKKIGRFVCSATFSKGIHATKINKVSGNTGHAAINSMPDKRLKNTSCDLFKKIPVLIREIIQKISAIRDTIFCYS